MILIRALPVSARTRSTRCQRVSGDRDKLWRHRPGEGGTIRLRTRPLPRAAGIAMADPLLAGLSVRVPEPDCALPAGTNTGPHRHRAYLPTLRTRAGQRITKPVSPCPAGRSMAGGQDRTSRPAQWRISPSWRGSRQTPGRATDGSGVQFAGALHADRCTVRGCSMRPECLELSMRIWDTGGEHGIWGGFVEADRRVARTRWLAGVPVTALVRTPAADLRRGRRDSRSASADPEPHVRRRSTSTTRSCDVPPHLSGAA
jgi:hypothetical protein